MARETPNPALSSASGEGRRASIDDVGAIHGSPLQRSTSRRVSRGLSLFELLVSIAIVALMMTAVVSGSGVTTAARVKRASTLTAGAIRLAYTRASATSRPHRIVLDIDQGRILIEESLGPMLVTVGEVTGGAEGQTEQEREAIEQAERILEGPRMARPSFRVIEKMQGFDQDEGAPGKSLGKGVQIRRVETSHFPDGQTEGRAYLYFWPGGETEVASIYLAAESAGPTDGITLLVSPLTGKVKMVSGPKSIPPMRDDKPYSEREERSY